MRSSPSKFIEILDPKDSRHFSASDVRLEDVLADHEATLSRPRPSTGSSGKRSLEKTSLGRANSTTVQRWKRISNILVQQRRNS